MSIRRVVSIAISCDGPGCNEVLVTTDTLNGPQGDKTGWRRVTSCNVGGGEQHLVHLCPSCIPSELFAAKKAK